MPKLIVDMAYIIIPLCIIPRMSFGALIFVLPKLIAHNSHTICKFKKIINK